MTQSPVRVLHIVGRMDRGGIENMIMNLYRRIDRTQVQFDFLAHYGREAAFNDEIRALGGRIYEMPALKSETRVHYWRLFSYLLALHRFFRDHPEYRILHGHMTNTAGLYLPIARRYGVTCRIAHSHSTKSKPGLQGVVTSLLQKPVHAMATNCFACSRGAARWLFPPSAADVKIFPNAIDLEHFRFRPDERVAVRRALSLPDGPVFICVARFRPEKNQRFLLQVLKHLVEQKPDAVMLFAGDGPCEEAVRAAAEELGLRNNTRFLGARSDIAALLSASDAFVLPSLWEGMPVSVIEALACGLPCVVSDSCPAEAAWFDPVTTISLQAPVQIWADALLHAAARLRTDLREKLRDAGFDICAAASWLQTFYLEKYREAME